MLPSEAYEEWKTMARYDAMCQVDKRAFPIAEPCEVCASIYYKGRRPDLDNVLASIGDAMEGILWTDDNLIMSWDGSRLTKDNEVPRVEITLRW